MALTPKSTLRLDVPRGLKVLAKKEGKQKENRDRFGHFTESIARGMGTPWFLFALSLFVILWMVWNTCAPSSLRFDKSELGFTSLTLVLSLQASYAAPMILLAQNRQDDRERVQIEQDRQRAERNLADTEYLAREVVALRLSLEDLASKDFLRSELKTFFDEVDKQQARRETVLEQLQKDERSS